MPSIHHVCTSITHHVHVDPMWLHGHGYIHTQVFRCTVKRTQHSLRFKFSTSGFQNMLSLAAILICVPALSSCCHQVLVEGASVWFNFRVAYCVGSFGSIRVWFTVGKVGFKITT